MTKWTLLSLTQYWCFSWSLGGACLIHTVAGDLLRSLDPRSPDMSPRLMSIASEEGVILVTFDKGHVCSYTINGKFLIQTDVNGKVNVSGHTKKTVELNYLGLNKEKFAEGDLRGCNFFFKYRNNKNKENWLGKFYMGKQKELLQIRSGEVCGNLFWKVLILKRIGGCQLNVSISILWSSLWCSNALVLFRRSSDRNIELSTTGSSQNQHMVLPQTSSGHMVLPQTSSGYTHTMQSFKSYIEIKW